ncbi:protein NRT1/ PTR FAMILY 2.13-like [Tripterygium wilfordii]|uniref:protein NRT1/ PTR FAMILY 2.13-like n=1 Tax=Tripterygium wilfordii TaxID=458696 RepID=UPI0018F85996|nr:protein NRT1/ PTR FAMILY 2.13-like [Tripterygium wilfordii]
MEVVGQSKKRISSWWPKFFQKQERRKPPQDLTTHKKPGGWKAMPFILGNESCERLATFGMLANLMVYFLKVFHMDVASAANLINIWSGVTNFAPVLGALISDAFLGKFKTIAFASFAALLGQITMTLTAWESHLHPPSCNLQQQLLGQCKRPNKLNMGILLMGLGLLSIGSGGIRPCSIPFGVDQFDPTTEQGRIGIASFYNWYYATLIVIQLFILTLVVYIQTNISWVLGFGLPTILMLCSIIIFFAGKRIYVHQQPEGTIFSSIAKVLVAAYRKRRLRVSVDGKADETFFDPPLKKTILFKLPLTNQFRFLSKAAIIEENDLNLDGSCANPWRLCSIQQVEEVKCLVRIIPIWSTGIIGLISIAQQTTFTISQALVMDRHLGRNFQVPAGSIIVISMIALGLWLPFYDRVIVPFLRKRTKQEGGITLMTRMGIGLIFSILSMVAAGLVERARRASANSHPQPLGISPLSVFWLSPQLILLGFCEAFYVIGQLEFYNNEFPEHTRSIGNSVFFCSAAGASYLSSFMISIVHRTTKPNWLANDLNQGRLDYFYFLLAGMGFLNFIYYLVCARGYRYKVFVPMEDKPNDDNKASVPLEDKPNDDDRVELASLTV